MTAVTEILAAALILGGATIVFIAAIGLLRLPDPFTRMHAATKAGVLGAGMLMFGVGLSLGSIAALITGLAGVVFLLATSPLASHALGRSAYVSGAPLEASTDALSGILPRNVVDLGPRRRAGSGSSGAATHETGETGMSAVESRRPHRSPRDDEAGQWPAPLPIRTVTAWLVGGPAQGEACAAALDIARGAGAPLTGLSAFDAEGAEERGAAPMGGMGWARWLSDQRRIRMRERAARSIADFERLCAGVEIKAAIRHEERPFGTLVAVAAGADIVIVPAGVDRIGEPASHGDEIAAHLSAAGVAPVLRVRRRRLAVRRVLMLVSDAPRSGQLAHALIRSGLWRDAVINIVAVGAARADLTLLADEQAGLLDRHGYEVRRLPPIDLEEEHEALAERVAGADAVLCAALSCRRGWFGSVREDVHEVAAEQAGLILLP